MQPGVGAWLTGNVVGAVCACSSVEDSEDATQRDVHIGITFSLLSLASFASFSSCTACSLEPMMPSDSGEEPAAAW